MANSSSLQYTFYFPTTKDKARWKRLCKPYTLNKWIFLMVERAISGDVRDTITDAATHEDTAETINELRKQKELLTAHLQQVVSELADLRKGSEPTMDKNVVEILKSGGVWTSTNIFKKLALNTFVANVSGDVEANTVIDPKTIERTLDTLQDWNLVENTWQGFKWIK